MKKEISKSLDCKESLADDKTSFEDEMKAAYPDCVINGKLDNKLLWNHFDMPTKLIFANAFKDTVPDARKLLKDKKSALKKTEKKFGTKIENPDTVLLFEAMMHKFKDENKEDGS